MSNTKSNNILYIDVQDIDNFRMLLVSTGVILSIAGSYLILGQIVLPMLILGKITYNMYLMSSLTLALIWVLIGKITSSYFRQYLLIKSIKD